MVGLWYGVHGGPTEPWTPIVQTEYQVLCIYSLAEPCKIAPIDYLIELAHMDMLLMVNLFLQCFIIQLKKKKNRPAIVNFIWFFPHDIHACKSNPSKLRALLLMDHNQMRG